MTISQIADEYLETVGLARSENTTRSYRNAMHLFYSVLQEHSQDPGKTSISDLSEDSIVWLAQCLKNYSAATERLYLQAVKGFFEFITAEKYNLINLTRIKFLLRQRTRRPGIRFPQFPRNEIEEILRYVEEFKEIKEEENDINLRAMRNRAFALTLADTGLRIHEICNLRRGDVDWNELRAIIIGKGNKQAVVRFSQRALLAIQDYLRLRSKYDRNTGQSLSSLPLFARHDKGAGKKIKPITTSTGRNIVKELVKLALTDHEHKQITPHSFRHYFVTTVLRGSGNLKLAQELARHASVTVTQRYAHLSNDELDRGYSEIFDGHQKPQKEI